MFKRTLSLDRYPLGLGYLAAVIRKETDWDVLVYNADFCGQSEQIRVGYLAGEGFESYRKNLKDPENPIWSEIQETVKSYKPGVVGISTKAQNFASACMVSSLVKEVDPSVTILAGGPHASAIGVKALSHAEIDVVVRGEGEDTVVELLRVIREGALLKNVRGIIYRDDGRVLENPSRSLIHDIDRLPFPFESAPSVLKDFHRYPMSAFRYVLSSRGCPHNCVFCGSRTVWGRQVRYRSPKNIVSEIQGLRKRGLRFIHFSDDTFGVDREHLREICTALLIHCPGIHWSCETHVNLINEETVSLMKRAGCHSIEIGIESGNNDILRKIRKTTTIERAIAACKTIKKNGIEAVALFMVGFPDDTEETLADTYSAMKKVRCDRIHFSIFTPYPGSEAYEQCKERGLIQDDHDPSLYGHQSPMNCFCEHLKPERFREIVSKMEKIVDRKNSFGRVKTLFSRTGFQRMQELGPRESFRKVARFFFGK